MSAQVLDSMAGCGPGALVAHRIDGVAILNIQRPNWHEVAIQRRLRCPTAIGLAAAGLGRLNQFRRKQTALDRRPPLERQIAAIRAETEGCRKGAAEDDKKAEEYQFVTHSFTRYHAVEAGE